MICFLNLQKWETLAKMTMGKSDLKAVCWLIFASDKLFDDTLSE